jgi:hypothetical protein
MAKSRPTRKALFTSAVRLEGMTVEQWAAEQPNERTGTVGISTAHLYSVLNGDTTSAPLNARIDSLVRKHFPHHAAATSAA